jgi:hypothetical protein
MRLAITVLLALALAPPLGADSPAQVVSKTFQVPYRLTSTNHVLVRVKINGKGPYNFILDTGAPTLFVTTAVGRELGLVKEGNAWGVFERFEIEGGVLIPKARGRIEDPFQLEGMNGLGLAGVHLHGMIGYTLLARYRLEFDFTKNKMGWTPLAFKPPQPVALGMQGGAPGGLDAFGTALKLIGTLLGKKPQPVIALRGYLGMALEDGSDGVLVKSVLTGGPADLAGLKADDRIQKFRGAGVTSAAKIQDLAARLAPDETVPLTLLRGSESLSLQIKAGRGL